MSKKHSSSIRKKIVRGYLRMYCFLFLCLVIIFAAFSYIAAYYITRNYVDSELNEVISQLVEDKNNGMTDEELYEKAQEIMPEYVIRYDFIVKIYKTKEEEYYTSEYYYYNNLSIDITDDTNESEAETESIETVVPEYTPAPEVLEDATEENIDSDYIVGYVTSEHLYLREYPDIESDIIYLVEYGYALEIIEDMGEWYKVSYEGEELYAVSKLISILEVAPSPTPEEWDEFWDYETEHLFSKDGVGYTSEGSFSSYQKRNAFTSLREPYSIYTSVSYLSVDEAEEYDYIIENSYYIKAVADVTDIVPYHEIWTYVAIVLVGIMLLFIIGFLIIWIYGAAKTKKYLKPINEITELANNIQPNSDYRLDVDTAKFELKELVITINNMLDRLNGAHIKRKKFVSDVSHELRTPISVIAGYANMLKRWAKDDEAVFDESVNAIIDESSNMKYLVENLLFLARSDNNQNVYEMEPFDISNLLQSICRDAKMVDKEKHDIICEVESGAIVNGDRNRLKQAFREFMQNAIKYTPPTGQIKMSLQKQEGKAIINIKDTGMGISKKDLGHIFTRFYRGDVSRNRDKGGYGLGLAICREVISAHNGKITIKSKETEGTIIEVTLNLS